MGFLIVRDVPRPRPLAAPTYVIGDIVLSAAYRYGHAYKPV